MISNYHTHTKRCRHAFGEDEDFVLAALDKGLQILGFSDHSPYIFDGDYYSTFRMPMSDLEDYVTSILALRKKYADRIDIKLGLELEYYPGHFSELMNVLKQYPFDYFLLGQHALGDEEDDFYTGWPTDDESLLKRYVHQCCDAMQTGVFTCFAHPDVMNFDGDPKIYKKHMRTLIKEAMACDIPLEFNLVGMHLKRHYTHPLLWQMIAEEGAKAIIGFDAHQPAFLKDEDLENKFNAFIGDLQINWIDKL